MTELHEQARNYGGAGGAVPCHFGKKCPFVKKRILNFYVLSCKNLDSCKLKFDENA